jgi:hypothetical protein
MNRQFGATSTTDEVLEGVDLSGKRMLVTGVSAGLGVETARTLAAHGAQVVGAARDLNKAKAATEQVRAQAANGGGLELVELDLASLASVRACADALISIGEPFDLVIANAGVMACPKGQTSDGFETQFGTNHLGHFVLLNRIVSLLKPGSRLVNLSSAGHRFSELRAHALYRVRGLWPLEDRQHPVRRRVRPEAQSERSAGHGRASRRHPDRAWPSLEPRGHKTANRWYKRSQFGFGRRGLQLENHPARRSDLGLERHRGLCRRGGRALLRGLPRGRTRRGRRHPRRRPRLRPRSGPR